MTKIEINSSYQSFFEAAGLTQFDQWMRQGDGKIFKSNSYRSVVQFSLSANGKTKEFFLKRHFKSEFKDRLRDWLFLHLPLSDGKQEWVNIQKIAQLGILTMKPVAWGEKRGFFRSQSFLVTESLGDLERLEDYLVRKFTKPLTLTQRQEKFQLIQQVADLVCTLHQANLFHRDLYCGHLLIDSSLNLYLIDLQRVRSYTFFKRRWQLKDFSALNYTAHPKAISRTDRLRFLYFYLGVPTGQKLTLQQKFWICKVIRRTLKTARHTEKKRRRYLS